MRSLHRAFCHVHEHGASLVCCCGLGQEVVVLRTVARGVLAACIRVLSLTCRFSCCQPTFCPPASGLI